MFKFFKRNKIVIYTAIFGGKDNLYDEYDRIEGCDYICFTDNRNIKSNLYKIIYIDMPKDTDPNRFAKKYKVLAYKYLKKYDYSLWIDGNILIKNFELKKNIGEYLNSCDIAVFQHPFRDCIYEEAKECIKWDLDNESIILKQIDNYKDLGYPKNNGLVACGIILRRHNTKAMKLFCDLWMKEINEFSKRDQLSFNYIGWKLDIEYSIISGDLYNNPLFYIKKHNF